jgi:hypothetical protein
MRRTGQQAEGHQPADLVERSGGVMRIGRTVIIPVILALGVAGSVLASAEMSAAAVLTPNVSVQQSTVPSTVTITVPLMKYHG